VPEPFCDIHRDAQRFREALTYTAAATGFSQRLIEKDYFCSLALSDFLPLFEADYVFKGGTCLSKVHANFYRMSEDLDFAFSIDSSASRATRRSSSTVFKNHIHSINARLAEFSVDQQITGHNSNRQYGGQLAYRSLITNEIEPIKIELSLREKTIGPTQRLNAATLLLNPVSGSSVGNMYTVQVMSLTETFSEKVRASITRQEPAIRDYYDLLHAHQNNVLDFLEPTFVELVRAKLATPGNAVVEVNDDVIDHLRSQIESRLKTVLNEEGFVQFNLDDAVSLLKTILVQVEKLNGHP
jgi:predicted nucleotidyltransferase component of viral defense system